MSTFLCPHWYPDDLVAPAVRDFDIGLAGLIGRIPLACGVLCAGPIRGRLVSAGSYEAKGPACSVEPFGPPTRPGANMRPPTEKQLSTDS
jgi:hypothetical protein